MNTTIFDHQRIAQLFETTGTTKAEVARKLGVRWETIHRACTGSAGISNRLAAGIAAEFNVPFSSLLKITAYSPENSLQKIAENVA